MNDLDSDRTTIHWFEEFAGEGKEESESLNLEYLSEHIKHDPTYHRGNFYMLPLRWRTSELMDIIERNREKINSCKTQHRLLDTLLNHYPQKHLESLCRSEIVEYIQKKYYEDIARKKRWTIAKLDSVNEEYRTILLPSIQSTEALLQILYSFNTISDKYRGFIPASMLYQYINTERCSQLDGKEGAYTLFDQELRKNIIVDKFDTIIFERAKLTETMPYAMNIVEQSESMTDTLARDLGNLASNAAFKQFKIQCAAQNERIADCYN